MTDKPKTTEIAPSEEVELALQIAKNWRVKFDNLENAFTHLQNLYIITPFASGHLSPDVRFELKIGGKVSHRDLERLAEIIATMAESYKDVEWTKPVEDRNV